LQKAVMRMIGLKRGTVMLSEHEKEWEWIAEATILRLQELFGEVSCGIEHVGSTQIRSIKAKPIIDIAVAVRSFDEVLPLIPSLEDAGFIRRNRENDRELFFVCGDFERNIRTHYIHVVPKDSAEWRNYIHFRDYLNAFPKKAREYEALKLNLMERYPNDRGAYTAGKAELIHRLLREALAWSYLGKTVTVKIDRPMGSVHPAYPDTVYPLNYGYLPDAPGGDGEELDCYVLGVSGPLSEFTGRVIGVIRRENDEEDKLVAAPNGMLFHQGEIAAAVHFMERYYQITIDCLYRKSCGTIIYRRNGGKIEYLLLLQRKSQTWSFPKGHMEAGETEEKTALREIYEEIGREVRFFQNFRVSVKYPVSEKTEKEVVLFLSELEGEPNLCPDEMGEYRWVSAEDAILMLYDCYGAAIAKAEEYLKNDDGMRGNENEQVSEYL